MPLLVGMVDLNLFNDWKYCSACGKPACAAPSSPSSSNNNDDHHHSARTKLLACADCGSVAYHNASCQKAHWRSGHRRECKDLAQAMLPLKELIRWHKMHKRVKKSNLEIDDVSASAAAEGGGGGALDDSIDVPDTDDGALGGGAGKRVWCWWEHDNENGITEETLSASDAVWEEGARRWGAGEYLIAMGDFQRSLEPYQRAWPYIGKSSGTNERREDGVQDFFDRSFGLARKLLFCAYCELDAGQVDGARQRLVQCISILLTIFFTTPSRSSREAIRNVLNDAWMELMLR